MDQKAFNDAWRAFPHSFAYKVSKGKWQDFGYLKHISKIITKTVLSGGGRIIVEAAPRHGKSEFISHWVPTWFLEFFPTKNVILASYESEIAASFGRKVRDTIDSNAEYLNIRLDPKSSAANRFNTRHGGGMITAGVNGAITGRGGNLMLIDDPVKNWKDAMSPTYQKNTIEWFETTFYTRAEPGATIIILQTRWHDKDLSGYLQANHKKKWNVIRLPALAEDSCILGRKPGEALCPQRYSTEALLDIKSTIGTKFFSALYQQNPHPLESKVWQENQFKRYDVLPDKFDEIIQSWDLTFKEDGSSFCVGQVWGRKGPDKYFIDQVRGKWGFTETIEKIMAASQKHPLARKKLIENKANGPAVEDTLKKKISGIELINPEGGKEVRARACEPQIESGHVWIPRDERNNPWVTDFLEEVRYFPNGKNDDQVDTASQALFYLENKSSNSIYKLVNY